MIDLKAKKIVVTGGAGFLGSYLVENLIKRRNVPKENIFIPRSNEYDLRDRSNCEKVVRNYDIIFHLAAFVGGIGFNREHPGRMFYDNMIMGAQLIDAAQKQSVEKFICTGTICAYPKFTPVPFKEDDLWNGYPEETNAPYGLAKKALLTQIQAYRKQYGFPGIYLLPVNLYGPRDNFDPNSSHVIPALIKKIADAIDADRDYIEAWGTGSASREFLYVEDAAEGLIKAAELYNEDHPVNIGAGHEIKIKDLVMLLTKLMNFEGAVKWDPAKPDGQPRRMLDVSSAKKYFGFEAQTDLEEGLKRTIDWYLKYRKSQ